MIKTSPTSLLEHQAFNAWREIRPESVRPTQIEILKEENKGGSYRLVGVGPDNAPIIAKRALRAAAMKERTVYEEVLPRLPLPILCYYGFVEEVDGRFCWLFLEDAGSLPYSPSVAAHRVLAAQWLGQMHVGAASLDLQVDLPDRGPDFYLAYLQSAHESIPQVEQLALLSAADLAVMTKIVDYCAFLGDRWNRIEAFCQQLPRTFIHDDCLPKNVHVWSTRDGPSVAVFDWGGAGWGLPATDLGQLRLPYRGRPPEPPDFAAYHAIVGDHWPAVDMQTIQRLANLGQLFWSLKVISRCLPEFDYNQAYLEYVMYNYRIYGAVLADSIQEARWLI